MKKDHEINFDACAFYIRPTRGLFDFQLEESVKLWKGKFNKNRPFFAIGDINVNVMTDVNGKIESVKGSRIDKLLTEFEHLLLRNKLQHHNIVPNGNDKTIDVCISAQNKFDVTTTETDSIFPFLMPEIHHKPLLYTFTLK